MVEKPKPADAPSNYMISGRYILQPEIFALLERQTAGAGGEIQVTDAMLRLAEQQPFFGYRFEGRIYDCGSKIGFLTANVAYALARADIAPAFRAELEQLIGKARDEDATARPGDGAPSARPVPSSATSWERRRTARPAR